MCVCMGNRNWGRGPFSIRRIHTSPQFGYFPDFIRSKECAGVFLIGFTVGSIHLHSARSSKFAVSSPGSALRNKPIGRPEPPLNPVGARRRSVTTCHLVPASSELVGDSSAGHLVDRSALRTGVTRLAQPLYRANALLATI